MRPASVKSYAPAFELGGPITNDTVARVIKSDSDQYKEGDLVVAMLPTAEYAVLKKEELGTIRRKVVNPHGLKDLGLFLGPLGMPGLTGWSSLHEIGKPKKGETIFISSAAGAVGQVVGQVAKREGLRVIGSVGSDDKLAFITEELGFDGGFNYKKEKPSDALKRLAPDGIDIYYENVGGEQLEAALDAMNNWGRIVACGMVSFLHEGTCFGKVETDGTADLAVQSASGGALRRQEPVPCREQADHDARLHCRRPWTWRQACQGAPGEDAAVAGRGERQGQAQRDGRDRQRGRGLCGHAAGQELWQGRAQGQG